MSYSKDSITLTVTKINKTIVTISKTDVGFILEDLMQTSKLELHTDSGQFLSRGDILYFTDHGLTKRINYLNGKLVLENSEFPIVKTNEGFKINIIKDNIRMPNIIFEKKPKWLCIDDSYLFWNDNEWYWVRGNRVFSSKVNGFISTISLNKNILFICYRREDRTYFSLFSDKQMLVKEKFLTDKIANQSTIINHQVIVSLSCWPSNKLLYLSVKNYCSKIIDIGKHIHSLTNFENILYAVTSSLTEEPKLELIDEHYKSYNQFELLKLNGNQSFFFPANNSDELIVFLHGGPIGSWINVYNPVVKALKDLNYNLILFNSTGSTTHSNKSTYKAMDFGRSDLYELVDAINKFKLMYKRIHLIGESYGGYLAWLYASKFPSDIRTVTILNGFIDPEDLISNNPAIKVLKRTLPQPNVTSPVGVKALYVGSLRDQLINVQSILTKCNNLNIKSRVIDSPHTIKKISHTTYIINEIKSFIKENFY